MHYFEIYERHFNTYIGKDINLLEIGVSHGGSLQMWKKYFGRGAKIYGADIDPRCLQLTEENISIYLVDQENRESLRSLKRDTPMMDIIIDDGGHTMNQQILTFEEMYGHVKHGGIYLVEDMHTSYWPGHFGGGYLKSNTFIEYCKNLIDQLNSWHSRDESLKVNDFTQSAFGVHFYDSVMVIEKRHMIPPQTRMKGIPSFILTEGEIAVLETSK
jgi:SAM-dependent methyltransferase